MRVLGLWLMMILFFWTGAHPARADACGPFVRQAADAMRSGAPETAAAALEKARRAHVCSGAEMARMGRMVAYAALRKAWRTAEQGSAREEILRRGLRYGRPWQALAALGDLLKARRDYAAAARFYQEALDDIADSRFNPRPPKPDVIRKIRQKAQIARQLAKTYVATPRGRSGEPGGLGRLSWRGFTVRKTAVPIEFRTGGTTYTQKGAQAVADMLDILLRQGAPDILLIGHTDERGGRAYNRKLSLARAKAVRAWLKARGYPGAIRVEGRGEEEPFELDDPSEYSREEIWQINRRVEMKLLGKKE